MFFSNHALAFNWEKCRKIASRGNGLGFSVSTTSYISSIGECSMVGEIKHDQKLFIANAYEPLQIDLARGSGEFADAFAEISKCNKLGKMKMKRALQKNYGQVYNDSNILDVEKTYSRIIGVLKSDQVIANNCKLES